MLSLAALEQLGEAGPGASFSPAQKHLVSGVLCLARCEVVKCQGRVVHEKAKDSCLPLLKNKNENDILNIEKYRQFQ